MVKKATQNNDEFSWVGCELLAMISFSNEKAVLARRVTIKNIRSFLGGMILLFILWVMLRAL